MLSSVKSTVYVRGLVTDNNSVILKYNRWLLIKAERSFRKVGQRLLQIESVNGSIGWKVGWNKQK